MKQKLQIRVLIDNYNIQKIMMISQDLCQILKYLREGSWDYTKLKLIQPQITQKFYEDLLISLLLECQQKLYSKSTAAIAKTYFDLAITRFPHLKEDNAGFYLVAALETAVHVSQSSTTSDQCTINFATKYVNSPFQLKKIILAQLQIGQIVEPTLRILTPYDYIKFFEMIMQQLDCDGQRKQMLIELIDLAISLPNLILCSQQDIFMACFLTVFLQLMTASDIKMIRQEINYKKVGNIQRTLRRSIRELQKA